MWDKWSNGISERVVIEIRASFFFFFFPGTVCTKESAQPIGVKPLGNLNPEQRLDNCLGWDFGNSHRRWGIILSRWSPRNTGSVRILSGSWVTKHGLWGCLSPGSRQNVLTFVNCSIQYKHRLKLWPCLHDPTFGNGLQIWVPSSCFMSTHKKPTDRCVGGKELFASPQILFSWARIFCLKN